MVIYVEYIFIDNLAINSFIMYITLYLLKKKINYFLLICSAIIGALFSVLYIFIANYNYLIKIILAPLLILILYKHRNFREYLYTLITFLIVSFCLAGVVVMFNSFTIVDLTKYSGEVQLIPFCFFGSSLIILILMRFCRKELYKRKRICALLYSAKVYGLDNDIIDVQTFYDSGNQLYDPEDKTPIVIISDRLYKKIPKEKIGTILVKTVAGYKSLITVNIVFRLYFSSCLNKIYKVQAGVSNDMSNEYDMILHTEMIGE